MAMACKILGTPPPMGLALVGKDAVKHAQRKLGNQVIVFFHALAFFCGKQDGGRTRSYYAWWSNATVGVHFLREILSGSGATKTSKCTRRRVTASPFAN